MDNIEKKGKRPRIGESRPISSVSAESRPESVASSTYSREDNTLSSDRENNYNQRPYRPSNNSRPYNNNRQGGYNQGYNRQGGYNNHYNNNGGYRPRSQQFDANAGESEGLTDSTRSAEGFSGAEGEQSGYQHRQNYNRPYNNNRQGGYNNQGNRYNNNRQGGYNQGGYNRQGGYNQNNRYNNRPYNNRPTEEGAEGEGNTYQPRQNSYNRPYNNNRQGGYNNQGNRRFNNNNNRQGGYNNQGNRRPGQNRQNQYGMPQGGKSFTPRPRPVEYEVTIPDPDEQIRLNKYMANAGICSRREADEYIKQGLVKVNGEVVTELGTKITHSDTIEYDDKVVTLERKCYILLNKPKDCVTTSDDPNGRLTVMDIVKGACNERIYPVGRLDRNTTGVLLLTNDGDLASKLTHPKYVKKKIYHVWTDKDISEDDMQRIADGIELDDGPIHADAISYATETDRNQAGIEIHSGRNRIVRRIFESLGYHVTKLDRVYFAGLTKKNLPRGRWRYLTQEEVNYLKMGSFE
ncbi:MAG: rRNA pseudouridine synthase [Lachnoclostridium sp.]|nr:rRNA pseudouridine synthase [Lachnoclostridium sp.]